MHALQLVDTGLAFDIPVGDAVDRFVVDSNDVGREAMVAETKWSGSG